MRKGPSLRQIPDLTYENRSYTKSDDTAKLFSDILGGIFPNVESKDEDVENRVDVFIKNYFPSNIPLVDENELLKCIISLNKESSPCEDGLSNQMLLKMPREFCLLVVKLINLTLTNGRIPLSWKHAKVSMIPKDNNKLNDPSFYRPISLTSCLGKLVEKVIQRRLYGYLESMQLISAQQSGFRKYRRTSDNLVFLTQKIKENFNRKKKTFVFFLIFPRLLLRSGMLI